MARQAVRELSHIDDSSDLLDGSLRAKDPASRTTSNQEVPK
jgi:hypothetical protein